MEVDVSSSVLIDRPLLEVYEYSAKPEHAREWYTNLDSVEWPPGRSIAVGSRVKFVAHFLGHHVTSTYEVTDLAPGSLLVVNIVEGPLSFETRYSWERVWGGTKMTVESRGPAQRFSGFSAGFVTRALRHETRKDLHHLKDILEGRGLSATWAAHPGLTLPH